jgi:hypothetical protein
MDVKRTRECSDSWCRFSVLACGCATLCGPAAAHTVAPARRVVPHSAAVVVRLQYEQKSWWDGRGSNTRPATMRSLDRRSGRAACAEYLLQGLAARGGVLCCQRVGAGPGLVTDDLLDGLAPAALAAVRQVAEELTVRESIGFQ